MDHANTSAAAIPTITSDRFMSSSFFDYSSRFQLKADAFYTGMSLSRAADSWSLSGNQPHHSRVSTSMNMARVCVASGGRTMKQLGLIALALAIASAIPASAEQWSKTYNIAGAPDFRVETTDANIRVDTWDQKTIEA